MKKILYFILSLSLGLTLVACSSNKNDEKTESSKSEEISDNTYDSATKEETSKSGVEEKQKESTTVEDAKKPSLVTLTTYTVDEDTLSSKTLSTVQVEDTLSIKDKLTKIADELSLKRFSGLPIKVVNVETVNGSKKATINLENLPNNNTISWSRTYFQGTTGGSITANILIDTFKQQSYTGDWIDSVQFLYNNEKIDFEHVENLASEIKLR